MCVSRSTSDLALGINYHPGPGKYVVEAATEADGADGGQVSLFPLSSHSSVSTLTKSMRGLGDQRDGMFN